MNEPLDPRGLGLLMIPFTPTSLWHLFFHFYRCEVGIRHASSPSELQCVSSQLPCDLWNYLHLQIGRYLATNFSGLYLKLKLEKRDLISFFWTTGVRPLIFFTRLIHNVIRSYLNLSLLYLSFVKLIKICLSFSNKAV